MLKHLNPDSKLICLAVHSLNEQCATSQLTALYFMYNHFPFLTVLNQFLYHFKIPCFYDFQFLVFIAVIIIFNDYFTFFYVKHFELPLCMKCAI